MSPQTNEDNLYLWNISHWIDFGMHKPLLHVLKASAGSGKTYALVKNYLKIVLLSNDETIFVRVMAMTFTNKATLEMKERIMENLLALSYPEKNKKSAQLLEDYAKDFGLESQKIQVRAKRILRSILHNYGSLSIMTLDKFSIRLVRSFTKDLDLPMDFNISIDKAEANELLYDQLTSAIGKRGEKELTQLLLQFATKKAENEESWNFKTDLIAFMELIAKEELLPIIEEVGKRNYDSEKLSSVYVQLNSIEKEYEVKRDELVNELELNNWQNDDFKTGLTDIYKRLIKLKTQSFSDIEGLTEKMCDNISSEKQNPKTKISSEYVHKIEHFYDFVNQSRNKYVVFTQVKNSFHLLALLKRIKLEVLEAQNRDNTIQIEDFNRLISNVIQSENAPYIYERIGTRYDHYMLDEFQDTSHLQWRNMLPLLHESLSSANENLIVGDAKQAIYRFRNGIIEQFEALPQIYNPENNDNIKQLSNYFNTVGKVELLGDNYRSRKEIVEFNNCFFSLMRKELASKYQQFYDSNALLQHPIREEGGLVSITSDDDEDTFVINALHDCLEDGFLPNDICILTRKNTIAAKWTQFLTEKGFSVISSEGLQVQNSIVVKCFIDYMRYREQIGNVNCQMRCMESIYRLKKDVEAIQKISDFSENSPKNPIALFIQKEFESLIKFNFPYENLYDLGQKWIRLMQLNEAQDAYLHHLCSMLHAFDVKKGADIQQFLTFYDRAGKKESVSLPETSDAIQVLTIHKSKGLQFPVVILPSLDWKYALKRGKRLFFDAEYDEIYMAGYAAKAAKNTTDYQIEKNLADTETNKLDEINLLYVALTRASERLYIAHSTKSKTSSIEDLFVKALRGVSFDETINENTSIIGKRVQFKSSAITQKSIIAKNVSDMLWFPHISLIDKNSLSKEHLHKEQRFGIQFHAFLANVSQIGEAEKMLLRMLHSNEIDSDFKEKMMENIKQLELQEAICELIFPTENESILNESEILLKNGGVVRPDRVIIAGKTARIIDFKTGVARTKDEQQVSEYMSVLKRMGYEDCKGYLLYTDTNTLVKLG